jgi:hypothetical protein
MRRTVAAWAACLALLAACGGDPEIYGQEIPAKPSGERAITLPEPIPATPAFVATLKKELSKKGALALEKIPGVAVVASITVKKALVEGPKQVVALRIAEVEPLSFRSVAPASTRDADFVWVSLIVGQAVPTFEAAKKLGLDGPGEIAIKGTPGFAVGAFADNGVPNLADVIVVAGAERKLKLGAPNRLVIGAKAGVTVEALGKDLRKQLPGVKLQRLIPQEQAPAQPSAPAAPMPVGQVSGGVVGAMSFEILPDGFIRPDPAWVSANIVSAGVPILGTVTCHRLLVPRLQGALADVEEAGLAGEIRPGDYGGCYVPRFIDRDPTKPLSYHAFGLALDFNVSTNGLGTRGDLHPDIVRIFQNWGFTWGGGWSRPDPMHFELSS